MKLDVAIIDYKMSNLHSVLSACKKVGLNSKITNNKKEILDAKSAILPGVGAFREAMSSLKKMNLDKCILDFINKGKPFIGICLGMQLLFERSCEFGHCDGLGIIKGEVKKFDFTKNQFSRFPVPHIGWNRIKKTNNKLSLSLLSDNADKDFMYFVHSYYVVPSEESVILTKTKYGEYNFCSSLQKKNVFAVQFHPEKSGQQGLLIYNNIYKKINGE